MFRLILLAALTFMGVAANEAPRFTHNMNGYSIPESTPIGTLVYILQGSDPDGDPVTFSILSEDLEIREPSSGAVYLKRQLDFEQRPMFSAQVSISDGVNTVDNMATIVVEDSNDNPPQFTRSTYTQNIEEWMAPGSVVISDITVTDMDRTGEPLSVTCQENQVVGSQVCEIFGLEATEPPTSTRWHGQLILRRSVNYESNYLYQVLVRAYDGENTAVQSLVVIVTDVQDEAPVFSAPLTAVLGDNIAAGSIVFTVSARDGDSVAPRPVRYMLVTNPGSLFSIDDRSGEIRAETAIDRNNPYLTAGYVNLVVSASELSDGQLVSGPLGTTTTQVTLSFRDTNDNAPTVFPPFVEVDMSESAEMGQTLTTLTVTDVDQGVNSLYEVMLDNNDLVTNTFVLVPSAGQGVTMVEIRVRDSTLVDYESEVKEYNLQVVARETQTVEQRSAVATVRVLVVDVNDNPPVFSQPFYEADVLETAPGGTPVITITATDLDSGHFGIDSVWYRIVGEGSQWFRVNKDGQITVAPCDPTPGQGECLDYEQFQTLNLTFQAADSYGEGHLTSVPVIIHIQDDNDNSPSLVLGNYTSYIEEGATIPNPTITVQATDADRTSVIRYSIITGNYGAIWEMNQASGFIQARSPVSYQNTPNGQGYFIMTVRATDGRYSDTGYVTIFIRDTNDNPPIFIPNGYYEETIDENTPPGTTVVRVTALDSDPPTSNNGMVRYRIISGSLDRFLIGQLSGVITVAPQVVFDYDVQNRYEMLLIAYDQGTPSLTATATAVIHIRDTNNKNPYFDPSQIVIDVNDNSPINDAVVTLMAVDPDASAALRYEVIEPQMAWDVNNIQVDPNIINFRSWFRIEQTTGVVRVNNRLSREQAARLSLTIQARDISGGPEQTAIATLIINILHFNDRPPIFPESPWSPSFPNLYWNVSEELPPGSYVNVIVAEDPDGGGIDSSLITINNVIDYESIQNLEIVVTASDRGSPQLTSTATIHINVININDNSPIFIPTLYNETIPEHSPVGTIVVRVVAQDRDLGDFGVVRYTLFHDPLNAYAINSVTGDLTVSNPDALDRETAPVTLLTVQAYDSPNNADVRRRSWADVYVYLTDVNDNPPVFTQPDYTGRIHETDPINTPIVTVIANDPDDGANGRITYHIISGNPLGLFIINTDTGLISSGQPLDGYNNTYTLTVEARDGGYPTRSARGTVIITIEPANRRPPTWVVPDPRNPDTAIVHVLEGQAPPVIVLEVRAIDPDPGVNGLVTYGLLVAGVPTETTPEFRIDPNTGQLTTIVVLDREQQDIYNLTLVARDQGRQRMSSVTMLTVIVDDIEDHNPWFPTYQNCCTIPYNFSVAENLASPQYVGRVQATDLDQGERARIIYYIIGGDPDHKFAINNDTGVINTARQLDHEQQAGYVLTVVAYNRLDQNPHDLDDYSACADGCRKQWEVLVYIDVTDENDTPPTFQYGIYNVCVSMDSEIGKSVTTIRATDYETNSGTIKYTMTSLTSTAVPEGTGGTPHVEARNNFRLVYENGTIYTTTRMDEYASHYFTMGIMANDSGPVTGHTQARIWVTEPAYEVTLTFRKPPTEIRGHERDIINWVVSQLGPDTIVCVNDIRYYINPEYIVVPGWTDVLIHVIDGGHHTMIPPHVVVEGLTPLPDGPPGGGDGDGGGGGDGDGGDGDGGGGDGGGGGGGGGGDGDGGDGDGGGGGIPGMIVGGMGLTNVKPTYSWWDGFNIHPVLIVVIVIFLLLLLCLLLLCCLACCAAGFCGGEEETTKKYIQPFMVPMQTDGHMWLERMYEDQELKMKLDNIDDIKLKGTINEGFQGDEIDHRANNHLTLGGGGMGNGHVQTTTQSDYQMNYEHSRTHHETIVGGGSDMVDGPGTMPMIVAELEPRDTDSGIHVRPSSGLYVHTTGRQGHRSRNLDYHSSSMPAHLNAAGLTLPRSHHGAIGATLQGSHTNLSQVSYSVRSEAYSPPIMPRSADPYVTTWPRGAPFVSELQITNDDGPAMIRAEPVLVTNENPVLVTDTLDFPEGLYQGEILLGTYRPPERDLRQEGMQVYNTHPGVYDNMADEQYY